MTKSNVLIVLGIIMLLSSYILPVFSGVIFPDKTLHGWEIALFTLVGIINIFDGKLELILATLFVCNLLLIAGIIIYFYRIKLFWWYKYILLVSYNICFIN